MGEILSHHKEPKDRISAATESQEESCSARVASLDERLYRLYSDVKELKEKATLMRRKLTIEGDLHQQPTSEKQYSAADDKGTEEEKRIRQLKSDLEELKTMVNDIRYLNATELSDDHERGVMTSDLQPRVTVTREHISTSAEDFGEVISSLEAQVEEVRQILVHNIEKALERDRKLDELVSKSEHLDI